MHCAFFLLICAKNSQAVPALILQAVRNKSPFDLLLIDRINNNTSFKIPAKELKIMSYTIEGAKSPFVSGVSLLHCMPQNAQFLIKQIDRTSGQPVVGKEVYMALWFATGGTHDGSGVVSGKLGYPVLKFFISDKEGLIVRRQTINLLQPAAKTVKVGIEFSINGLDTEQGLFKLFGDCEIAES